MKTMIILMLAVILCSWSEIKLIALKQGRSTHVSIHNQHCSNPDTNRADCRYSLPGMGRDTLGPEQDKDD